MHSLSESPSSSATRRAGALAEPCLGKLAESVPSLRVVG